MSARGSCARGFGRPCEASRGLVAGGRLRHQLRRPVRHALDHLGCLPDVDEPREHPGPVGAGGDHGVCRHPRRHRGRLRPLGGCDLRGRGHHCRQDCQRHVARARLPGRRRRRPGARPRQRPPRDGRPHQLLHRHARLELHDSRLRARPHRWVPRHRRGSGLPDARFGRPVRRSSTRSTSSSALRS